MKPEQADKKTENVKKTKRVQRQKQVWFFRLFSYLILIVLQNNAAF